MEFKIFQIALVGAILMFVFAQCNAPYYPPPDAAGGWRTLNSEAAVRKVAGMDLAKLDTAFEYIKGHTKNGGLLVVRNGWLVYENYFGKGHRLSNPNLASCGKSFTSIAVGILVDEKPELFPEGLDQKIFTPEYLPPLAFPLSDPAKADIKLGQLLAFSAGIRGNNPSYIDGEEVTIDPPGPDGWFAMVDSIALGKEDYGDRNGRIYSAQTLWCEPGGGYSYATASIHIASIMLRQVSGMELKDYLDLKVARPLGWGEWSFAYQNYDRLTHTPGGAGIALHATDMLRFGYLLLHNGRWVNQQIIPADYLRHCSSQSPYNPHYPYSLQFNVNTDGNVPQFPPDAFWKRGSGGHCIYVVPSEDLVVWKLGGRDSQYDPNNTGLPLPEEVLNSEDTRAGFKPKVTDDEATVGTLKLVLEAIVE